MCICRRVPSAERADRNKNSKRVTVMRRIAYGKTKTKTKTKTKKCK